MKLKTIITASLLLLFFMSCGSDHLSNSKAEDIISECLDDNPIQRTARLKINKAQITKNEIEKYKQLADEGMIEMKAIKQEKVAKDNTKSNDPLSQWRKEAEKRRRDRYTEFNIKLTKKGQKHVIKGKEYPNDVVVNTFRYEVDQVLEVQEIPAMNGAKVKVQYEADDITPFSILSTKDPAEFWIKDLKMTKTSNGWKYCDNY